MDDPAAALPQFAEMVGLLVHRAGRIVQESSRAGELLPPVGTSDSVADRLVEADGRRLAEQLEALDRGRSELAQLVARPRGGQASVFLSSRRVDLPDGPAVATVIEPWALDRSLTGGAAKTDRDGLIRRLPEALSSAAEAVEAEVRALANRGVGEIDALGGQARRLRSLARRLINWRAGPARSVRPAMQPMDLSTVKALVESRAAAHGRDLTLDGDWPQGQVRLDDDLLASVADYLFEALGAVATSGRIILSCAENAAAPGTIALSLSTDALGLSAVGWTLPLVQYSGLTAGRPAIGLHEALGVDIAAGIVAAMDGGLALSFIDDRRAQIDITLTTRSVEASPEPARTAEPAPTAIPHILIVEDNAISRDLAVMTATRRGYRVDSAQDGQEAVERLAEQTYDLVLMDLRMPRMDGFEATRQIKKRAPGQRVVAMSATEIAGEETAIFDGFLAKPVNWNAVAEYLAAARSGEQGGD